MAESVKSRSEIDPVFKWNVNNLVESDNEWEKLLSELRSSVKDIASHKSTFTQSAKNMLDCFKERDSISQKADILYVYATMKMHEDTTDSKYQGMSDQAENLVIQLSTAMSFIEPMLLSMDEEALYGYLREEPELTVYTHYIDDLLRQKEHVLSPELEELLAGAGEIGLAADNIFSMLNDADIKFGMVQDDNGEDIELTHGRYGSLMESYNRDVRRKAFETLYTSYESHKNTLAATYNASVKKDIFFSRSRKYDSSLSASLSRNNIPIQVYENLIKAVNEHLPHMHRYMKLRKNALKLDELHMYDVHTPIVPNIDTHCSYEEAKENCIKAFEVMGEEYIEIIKKSFTDGWIDVYENKNKNSGAYSWGAYGSHPYVLLNYDNMVGDMFTLAHELGHAMHSHYTWQTQPYIYSSYSLFLAEVASTVNESLLMAHLRKTVSDKAMLAYLVNYFLDQFRTTVFRQTMFAEFEMMTHSMAEEGKPLTHESLNCLYRGLNEKYYGPEVITDPQIDFEWSRIPHFYSAFYVYQYATGFSAAVAFSKHILERGEPAVKLYTEFLKNGSNDYPINVLRNAGVDMDSTVPVNEAMQLFAELVTEMENIMGGYHA